MSFSEQQAPVIYTANEQHTAMVQEVRDRMLKHCGGHMHKHVRVQTLDGHIYEGRIVHVDRSILYLQVTMQDPRSILNPYNVILPLVLYELLVITLLYT
ncbi:acetyl-CoA acetyltransferase [Paenibacillus sp. L3-i20]|uniref:acetyl-CoA acetyltransferase n=1 Tax=Paenibacillus sp. L3-i20 TaxID=2905833 RepID=UPI001EDCD9A2|nr:acetyl-CoA acetyltransferase [Paenibacillus sp. L3-i20]GKU77947.1 hypothetical protein L3i20_v223440 [Paenibacillus sp. L3-i20]